MRELKSLEELLRDYRRGFGNAKDGHSGATVTLESIIVLASRKYRKIMSDIGNDDDQENKDGLCKAIQDDVAWEKHQLL
tara:strand:+ start:2938 stop:3174 length:237 start_codon:yes stop_codon:yes gene_type:complete